MGELLRAFTYPRNSLGGNAADSISKVTAVISRVRSGQLRQVSGQDKDEPFNDCKAFLGVVARDEDDATPVVTELGREYETLALKNEIDAWRWLLTRSMWRYTLPTGTHSAVNPIAERLGIKTNFFDLLLRVCMHLSAESGDSRNLYFDELLPILDDDDYWSRSAHTIYDEVSERRGAEGPTPMEGHRSLLDDLEREYAARDNYNTVFRKAFGQCGLFDLVRAEANRIVGVRISDEIWESPVLYRRLRFVLDHPTSYKEWSAHLDVDKLPATPESRPSLRG